MKKIYILGLFLSIGLVGSAQSDLTIAMDNHNNGDATSQDPLIADFTVTNNGTALTDQDTIYFGVTVGTTYYTTTLVSGSVSGGTVTGGLANGASFPVDVDDMDSQWIYAELGDNTNGNVCVTVLGVGDSVLASPYSSDANPNDNIACVDYTVPYVAGIEDQDVSTITAYPNPASNELNIDLGTNNVDQIQIVDLSGRIVANIQVNDNIEQVNVNDYENGVYFYQVISNNAVIKTDKFVVTK